MPYTFWGESWALSVSSKDLASCSLITSLKHTASAEATLLHGHEVGNDDLSGRLGAIIGSGTEFNNEEDMSTSVESIT